MLFDDNQMLENILESDGCRTCFRIDNDLSNKSSAHLSSVAIKPNKYKQ